MISLKSLLKEEESFPSKSWWLDSNGILHPVEKENHAGFAAQYLSTQIKKYSDIDMGDVYKSMYKLGWIRLIFYGYHGQRLLNFNLRNGGNPNSNQMATIDDIIKEYNVDELFDCTNGKRYPSHVWE